MSPDHWSKLTWDTVSAGGYDLFGPIGYLDRIRDRACKQRVIVTCETAFAPTVAKVYYFFNNCQYHVHKSQSFVNNYCSIL